VTKKKISETRFKEKVLKDLKTLSNIYFLKTQERARRGVPDIIFCANGGFGAMELKKDGEDLEPLQRQRVETIRQARGFAIKSCPATWEQDFLMIKKVFYR
jgi:hypothetical protein